MADCELRPSARRVPAFVRPFRLNLRCPFINVNTRCSASVRARTRSSWVPGCSYDAYLVFRTADVAESKQNALPVFPFSAGFFVPRPGLALARQFFFFSFLFCESALHFDAATERVRCACFACRDNVSAARLADLVSGIEVCRRGTISERADKGPLAVTLETAYAS